MGLVEREKVCVAEVWQVLFGGDMKYLKRRDSNEIVGILTALKGWKRNKNVRRYGVYGAQKGLRKRKYIIFRIIKTSRIINLV